LRLPLRTQKERAGLTGARGFRQTTLFASSITDLKSASTLALDDDLAVQQAQFDLANVAASGIDFLRDQVRALQAVVCSARRNVFASVDANGCRRGVEIGLKHRRDVANFRSWRAAVKRTTLTRTAESKSHRQGETMSDIAKAENRPTALLTPRFIAAGIFFEVMVATVWALIQDAPIIWRLATLPPAMFAAFFFALGVREGVITRRKIFDGLAISCSVVYVIVVTYALINWYGGISLSFWRPLANGAGVGF
jgi:hypothetical protein